MNRQRLWPLALVIALALIVSACGAPAAPVQVDTGAAEEEAAPAAAEEIMTVNLVARCKASPPYENGRCDNLTAAVDAANAVLEASDDNRRIALETIQDDTGWGDYKTEFELASDAGEAPDIIVSGHEHIGDWATAGYLVDISEQVNSGEFAEFEDVIDSLWESTMLEGKIWGIPQDAEARPLYFSKLLLSELGWSAEEIEALPGRIESCDYTWQDMFDTAQQAVEAGVVNEGEGWWHRPSNGPDFLYYYFAAGGEIESDMDALAFDTAAAQTVYELLHNAVHERKIITANKLDGDWDYHKEYTSSFANVMFVFEGTWRWASWHTNYLQDQGGEAYLFENVGFAPIPCMEGGIGKPITLTHPLVYMISTQSEHPDLALLLLAKATVKELNTPYAVESGHLGILKSQADHDAYTSAEFLSATLPLLEHTTFLPNSPYWSAWSEAYYLGIQAVESGDLSPSEAIEVVIEQLQNELGDNVIIE